MRTHHLLLFTFLVVLTLIVCPLLPCQTELWRSDGWLRQVRPDGLGNTYFLRGAPGTWYGPDTLYKVDPAGLVLWSKPLNAPKSSIYPNGEGIYIISDYNPDSVYYYDAAGSLRWTYVHPSSNLSITGLFDPLPLLDPAGNLVFPALNTYVNGSLPVGNNGALVKLAKDGTVLFETLLPDAPSGPQSDGSFITRKYDGPFVDRAGNIWMSLDHSISTDITAASGIRKTHAVRITEFLLFDGTSGSLRFRKQVYKGVEDNSKYTPEGKNTSAGTDSPFERFVTGDGLFVGYGNGRSWKETTSPARGTKHTDQGFWFVTGIDAFGKIKTFKFKGNGKEILLEGSDSWKGDGSSNYIYDVWIGKDNALYLTGEISRGTKKNDVGELHYDFVILKMTSLNKTAWKKVFLDGMRDNFSSTFFHEGEQKLMMLSPDQRQITLIDQNGAVGSTTLSVPDALWRFIRHNDAMIYSNTEAGILYAAVDGASFYGAKYSLPPTTFGPASSTEASGPEESNEYVAEGAVSNYPNPFNPSTTISFTLGNDALMSIIVYNSLGQEIAVLAKGEEYFEGENEVNFDGSNLPTGIYYYRMTASGVDDNRPLMNTVGKMMIMK